MSITRPIIVFWDRSVRCTVHFDPPGAWLARRNGVPVSRSQSFRQAMDFARGEWPRIANADGTMRPDYSVPGVKEAVAAFVDEMESLR